MNAIFGLLCVALGIVLIFDLFKTHIVLSEGRKFAGPAFIERIWYRLTTPLYMGLGFFGAFLAVTLVGFAGSFSLWLGFPLVLAALYFSGKVALDLF